MSSSNDQESFGMTLDNDHGTTLSQHLFDKLRGLSDPSVPLPQKLETSRLLLPFLKDPDAHLDLCGTSQGFLPVLDWNGCFRKSYSLLFWVRPTICTKENCNCHTTAKEKEEKKGRILYRFGTSPQDGDSLGVCATLGEWSAVKTTSPPLNNQTMLQTTVTVFSLPHQALSHAKVGISGNPDTTTTPIHHSTYVSCPLILPAHEWSLVGINHVFPYLKRPQWTLVVNGNVLGSGELSYPVLESKSMSHNSILCNVVEGGARVMEESSTDATTMPVSQLQQQTSQKRWNLHMHVCSIGLYGETIEPMLQAVLADAGPFLSLQQEGRIVGLVPPVSNWSKGTGLDGPHVGIPLMALLDIQKLASQSVLSYSAASLLILRNPHRIVLPSSHITGETETTPKVGLMEPALAPVQRDAPLVLEGSGVGAVHTLAEFLLQTNVVLHHDSDAPQLFSLLLYEQNALASFVLPFFLSLPPPARKYQLQQHLYANSFPQLHALYAHQGEYASVLILMLATAIQYGGARVHEEVLQSGLIHSLVTTLRRSLLRACELKLFDKDDETCEEFCKRAKSSSSGIQENHNRGTAPPVIPTSVAHACAQLLHACCGPACPKAHLLTESQRVRRSSDLALTAVFGMALDWDLWGQNVEAASIVLQAVADRYGGPNIAYGILLRNQVPVQFLLDSVKLQKFHRDGNSAAALEQAGLALSQILFSMLLASLNNRKIIAQAEHDVAACMGALTDTSLGSLAGHAVLQALCLLLKWCDILPEPSSSSSSSSSHNPNVNGASLLDKDDDDESATQTTKTQVASRLGRNLLMGQYHDVVAPMLLSRTISSGSQSQWKRDWRLALVVFSWLASISGAEGEAASKTTGKLLLASALAGSLQGCLIAPSGGGHSRLVSCLFLPPPVMALSIIGGGGSGSNKRDKGSWSYSDLLSDRLRVMMPLLPGLVVSLFPPQETQEQQQQQPMEAASLSVLTELIAAVGGAFHRVYGGLNQQAPRKSSRMMRRSRRSSAATKAVKAAKDYVPHLLVVAMLLENDLASKRPDRDEIQILSSCAAPTDSKKSSRTRTNSETEWVDVNTTLSDSANSYSVAYNAERRNASSERRGSLDSTTNDATLAKLSSCQSIVLNCLTDLIANAMKHGGGEASTEVWRSVIVTLSESLSYSKKEQEEEIEECKKQSARNMLCRLAALVLTKVVTRENDAEIMWSVDLCSAVSRLCGLVEEKELLRTPIGKKKDEEGDALPPYSGDQVLLQCALLDIMSFGREVTGWCQLVLHPAPQTQVYSEPTSEQQQGGEEILASLSPMREQVADLLDGAIVQPGYDLYQRVTDDVSVSSIPNTPLSPRSRNAIPPDPTPGATSKLLLPILQPSLRIVLGCFGNIRSNVMISVPQPAVASSEGDADKPHTAKMALLSYTANELRHTLTAAIVGLSFPNARDVALNTLASLRRAMVYHRNAQDDDAVKISCFLFVAISEEIRVRYDGERRLRDKALFDAYEDDQGSGIDSDHAKAEDDDKSKEEAESSRAVERLILGGDLIPSKSSSAPDSPKTKTETVTFGDGSAIGEEAPSTPSATRKRVGGSGSEDFVMFHETYASPDDVVGKDGGITRMGWSHYKGLGLALEKCSELAKSKASEGHESQVESMLTVLTSYLDTWDENIARDAVESELVELFNDSVTIQEKEEDGPPPLPLSPLGSKVQAALNSSAPALPIIGSETAADAMTNFIEFSSVEKSRLKEVESTFLPSRRSSCVSFAERYCWAQYMEFTKDDTDASMSELWERTMADGNRDVRSRLITMPCNPQFRRFIPAWLDHGPSAAAIKEDGETPAQEGEDEGVKDRAGSMLSRGDDIDLSVAKKLAEAGDLEIVDITKKEIEPDEENDEILLGASIGDLEDTDIIDVSERPRAFSDFPDDDEADAPPSDSYSGPPDKKDVDKKKPADESASSRSTDKVEELKEKEETIADLIETTVSGSSHHHIQVSPFSHPPDNSSATLSLVNSAAASLIEFHFDNCLHVKTEGSRKCAMLLTATHLILEFDAESEGLYDGEMMAVREEAERQKMIEESRGSGGGESEAVIEEELEKRHRETAALRPKCMRFNISELSHVYLRRYRLRDSALEMFFIPSGGSSFGGFGLYAPATSLFIDFGPGYEGNIRRDDAANAIMRRAPPQTIKQWPDRSGQFLHEQLSRLAMGWVEGRITNFDYLLHLNILSGRSYNDLCQYPVMPWVLSNFYSKDIPDLSDRSNFRDLTKPMGALNPDRLSDFMDRFETFADPTIPPFMYGSHYSTSAGVVLHFLVRMHPFAGLHRQLQGGHFDVADRLFSSVPRTWDMCTGSSAAEVKELTPEWYCNPSFLKNTNKFKFGSSQEGEMIGDVTLPPWANGSPEKFVEVMRDALESDICSEMLPDWIDLVFGRKQQGPEAIKAHNVFFYLTYYGSVDVASIEDESLRTATELQIAHFGQCPMQLFRRPHVRRVQRWRNYRRLTFYQMLSAYTQGAGPSGNGNESDEPDSGLNTPTLRKDGQQRIIGEPLFLPFFSAPVSHWVHLAAPPPGPHADLIAVRLAGLDRCLAVDAHGIFHSFRWAWKPEDASEEGDGNDEDNSAIEKQSTGPIDKGGFVAQRELPRFRTVPRLPHIPTKRSGDGRTTLPAVGISKTLFAGRSVLLVLSDGDGRGALAMQLVDPAKGTVRGEAIVPSVHSSRITSIAMDPIGTAAGHGGVGGELAILGSADGGASIWRFMSSHFLPLRPRVRMRGHGGAKVHAVALSSSIHVCATVSENRCCIFSVGNGGMIRSFSPPQDTLDGAFFDENTTMRTVFADTPALCLSVQGFLVCVCKTTISSADTPSANRSIITLHLFSLEGVSLGSKALESWRGIPHKISSTPDGTAIFVCSGRGITIHRLSSVTPLEFIDEWHITENEELDENVPTAWDVDFGPSILRPVVGAAACSSGTLRLHALPGITHWSERHKKSSMTAAVGQALAKPAQRIKSAMGKGFGIGSRFVGMGKDIGKEVQSDVKERGVGGFLGGVIFRKGGK